MMLVRFFSSISILFANSLTFALLGAQSGESVKTSLYPAIIELIGPIEVTHTRGKLSVRLDFPNEDDKTYQDSLFNDYRLTKKHWHMANDCPVEIVPDDSALRENWYYGKKGCLTSDLIAGLTPVDIRYREKESHSLVASVDMLPTEWARVDGYKVYLNFEYIKKKRPWTDPNRKPNYVNEWENYIETAAGEIVDVNYSQNPVREKLTFVISDITTESMVYSGELDFPESRLIEGHEVIDFFRAEQYLLNKNREYLTLLEELRGSFSDVLAGLRHFPHPRPWRRIYDTWDSRVDWEEIFKNDFVKAERTIEKLYRSIENFPLQLEQLEAIKTELHEIKIPTLNGPGKDLEFNIKVVNRMTELLPMVLERIDSNDPKKIIQVEEDRDPIGDHSLYVEKGSSLIQEIESLERELSVRKELVRRFRLEQEKGTWKEFVFEEFISFPFPTLKNTFFPRAEGTSAEVFLDSVNKLIPNEETLREIKLKLPLVQKSVEEFESRKRQYRILLREIPLEVFSKYYREEIEKKRLELFPPSSNRRHPYRVFSKETILETEYSWPREYLIRHESILKKHGGSEFLDRRMEQRRNAELSIILIADKMNWSASAPSQSQVQLLNGLLMNLAGRDDYVIEVLTASEDWLDDTKVDLTGDRSKIIFHWVSGETMEKKLEYIFQNTTAKYQLIVSRTHGDPYWINQVNSLSEVVNQRAGDYKLTIGRGKFTAKWLWENAVKYNPNLQAIVPIVSACGSASAFHPKMLEGFGDKLYIGLSSAKANKYGYNTPQYSSDPFIEELAKLVKDSEDYKTMKEFFERFPQSKERSNCRNTEMDLCFSHYYFEKGVFDGGAGVLHPSLFGLSKPSE